MGNAHIRINDEITLKCDSFEIEKGDRILLNGPTGCGKTYFVEALLGLNKIDDLEQTSSIEYFDSNEVVSYVSQTIPIFELSEYDNTILGRDACNESNSLKHSLERKIRSKGKNISGGEKILVGLNRALICSPSIIILDEIDRNLDSGQLESVIQFCDDSVETILYISHINAVSFTPNKVVSIEQGVVKVDVHQR